MRAFLGLFIGSAFIAVIIIALMDAADLRNSLTQAGYNTVQKDDTVGKRVTAIVRGCKIGAELTDSTATRVINGERVDAFTVSIISDGGTWTPINMGNNVAPTPDELTAHLASLPCYNA